MIPKQQAPYHCTCPSNQTITNDLNPFDKNTSDHDVFCDASDVLDVSGWYPGAISSKLTMSSSLNTLLQQIGDPKQFGVSLRNIVETAENLLTAFEGVLNNGSKNSSTHKSIRTIMAPRTSFERNSEESSNRRSTYMCESQQERQANWGDESNTRIKPKQISDLVGAKCLRIRNEGHTIGRNRTTQNDCHRDHTNLSIQPNKIKCAGQGQHPAGPIQNQEAKDNNDYDDDDDYDEIDNDNDNCECDKSSDQYFTPRGAYLFEHEEANLPIYCDQQSSDRLSNGLQISKPGSTIKVSSHIPEGSFECISKFCSEQGVQCVQVSSRDLNLTSSTSSKTIQDLETNSSPSSLDPSNLSTSQFQVLSNSSAVQVPSNEKVVSLLENIYEVLNSMRNKPSDLCPAATDESEVSRIIPPAVSTLNSQPNSKETSSVVKWLDSCQYLDQSQGVDILEPPERDIDISGRTTKRLIPVDMDLLRADEAFDWIPECQIPTGLESSNEEENPSSSNFHHFGINRAQRDCSITTSGLDVTESAAKVGSYSQETTLEREIKNSNNFSEKPDPTYEIPSTRLASKTDCFEAVREPQGTQGSVKFESEELRKKSMALLDSFGYKWACLSKRAETIAQRLHGTTSSSGDPSDCHKEPEHTTSEQVQVNISFMQCLTFPSHHTQDMKASLPSQKHDSSTKIKTPQIRMIENSFLDNVDSIHGKENLAPRPKNEKLDSKEIEPLKAPLNPDEISFIDSVIEDLEVIQQIPDNPQRFKNINRLPTQPFGEPFPKLREGFPVSITKVEALGTNSLFVKWKIYSFLNVGGYEVFLDGHLTNRYFSCIHRAAVICDVNLQFSHRIVLRAQPIVQQQNHKQLPSLACNPEASSRQPDGSTWHPSVYYYEPNSSSAP